MNDLTFEWLRNSKYYQTPEKENQDLRNQTQNETIYQHLGKG